MNKLTLVDLERPGDLSLLLQPRRLVERTAEAIAGGRHDEDAAEQKDNGPTAHYEPLRSRVLREMRSLSNRLESPGGIRVQARLTRSLVRFNWPQAA